MCSKCHLIKGTAANGSFTLHRFNYLNEVSSKKSTLLLVRSFFAIVFLGCFLVGLFFNKTPFQFVFFPF